MLLEIQQLPSSSYFTFAVCLFLKIATSQGIRHDAFCEGPLLLISWPCHAAHLSYQKKQRAHSFCI
jgi:hypothetical protein